MKKTTKQFVSVFLLSSLLLLTLLGCGDKSGNTIDEPEITSEYLQGEYAQQLITDGAETMVGYIDITKEGDTYNLHISEQEVVPNSDYDEGYYIADTNITKDVSLGLNARIVCNDNGEPIVVTIDDFIKEHADGSDNLYTVYLMGNSAELILYTDPADILAE